MKLRRTEEQDMDAVIEIYENAKAFLKASGVNQWQDGYPNRRTLTSDMALAISLVCEADGEILATAAAYVGHEPTYDRIYEGCWLTAAEAYGIVHRIAVAPGAKEKGIAQAVFAYTEQQAQAAGCVSLRCDTHRDNRVMQRALEKAGYRYCGLIYLEDGDERFAYEKPLRLT